MSLIVKQPNFFIVGAPKCGTTAMQVYLAQHPEIFFPNDSSTLENVFGGKKELHFFCKDLNFKKLSNEQYLSYFSEATTEKVIGEASVFYLYSKIAAQEIKQFCPNAKILIMLRNPIDMMLSWHSQMLFWGDEILEDFEQALIAEESRKRGVSIPKHHDHPIECFFYREIAKLSDQLERYTIFFEPKNLHIIIYDDFKTNLPTIYQKTLKFLEVDTQFQPSFEVINSNKKPRSKTLQSFLHRPPDFVRDLSQSFLPSSFRKYLRVRLLQLNIQHKPRTPLSSSLLKQLQQDFEQEVIRLSELIGRDLSNWISPHV